MTAAEIKAARRKLGETALQFGRGLGYKGTPATVNSQVYKMERGTRPVPLRIGIMVSLRLQLRAIDASWVA